MQKQTGQSNQEQIDFYATLNTFLDNQTKYQNLNTKIAQANNKKESLESQKRLIRTQISAKTKPARAEHAKALRAHRLKLAFYQLLLLIPVLVVSTVYMLKKRDSVYAPFFRTPAGAALVKVGLVAHEYFPTEYFKINNPAASSGVSGGWVSLYFAPRGGELNPAEIKNAFKTNIKTLINASSAPCEHPIAIPDAFYTGPDAP